VIDNGSGEGSGSDPEIDIDVPTENISPEEYDEETDEGSGSGGGGLLIGVPEEESPATEEPDTGSDDPTRKPHTLQIFEGLQPSIETTLAPPEASEEPVVIKQAIKEESARAPIIVAPPNEGNTAPDVKSDDLVTDKKPEESGSTYILLAVLGILLVSLILYVVVKRRRNRRRSSYNHNDPENVREIEMLDMKKNSNGKQSNAEIVPLMPKIEQPKIEKGMGDQNKEINSNIQPLHATTYPKVDTVPLKQSDEPPITEALPENNNNFSQIEPETSQEIPKAADEIDDTATDKPIENGHNGHLSEDEVFMPEEPTVKRYSPVYSPETGRVKIKLMETPKPKTPMLVTRSRSNAGAYITTPNLNIRATSANGQ